jgi:hypothetical protein
MLQAMARTAFAWIALPVSSPRTVSVTGGEGLVSAELLQHDGHARGTSRCCWPSRRSWRPARAVASQMSANVKSVSTPSAPSQRNGQGLCQLRRALARSRAVPRCRSGAARARLPRVPAGRSWQTRGRASSPAEPAARRLRRNLTCRNLPSQQLRALQRHRERLGVDHRLLRAPVSNAAVKTCCAPRNPRVRRELQQRPAGRPHPASRGQGAARTSAPPRTAFATVPRRGSRRRSTPRPRTSGFAASSGGRLSTCRKPLTEARAGFQEGSGQPRAISAGHLLFISHSGGRFDAPRQIPEKRKSCNDAGCGSGETRTRTGDTTIFRQLHASLERPRKSCKNAASGTTGPEPRSLHVA